MSSICVEENPPFSISTHYSEQSFIHDLDIAPPYFVDELEAKSYYEGIRSSNPGPVLIYRTSKTPWKRPTGPEAHRMLKEIKPVFDHEIVTIWNDLGPKIWRCLDSARVIWTSVDVVRFAIVGELPGPPVLWIGVMPEMASAKDAHTAAIGCKKLLKSYKITDVEIEFRESALVECAGPKLLKSLASSDITAGVRAPLTAALGLPIAARATSYAEGTGGLYISDGDKIYVLSARHVIFPPSEGNNELYDRTNGRGPRHDVLLAGPEAFQTLLNSIVNKIEIQKEVITCYKRKLDSMKDNDAEVRTEIEGELTKATAAMITLSQFNDEITKYWREEEQRVLGHIAYSPPIAVGTGAEAYTEDWCLVELNRDKIDWDNFKGNVIDLGTDCTNQAFTIRMYPDNTASTYFKYPPNRLLPLRGVIEEDELRRPQMRDGKGEPCLMVIKSGCATGVTIGRATGVMSFVRKYFSNGRDETSMEWAIMAEDRHSGPFSARGDSGAIIVDGKGRIGGLITNGIGQTDSTDITYATPFSWLLRRIKARFPAAHSYQPPA